MNTSLRSIGFNEASYNVALVHKTLEVLGLPVSKKEVELNKAGPDTRKKVRALQAQLNIGADESTLVNEATIAAMVAALRQRGLTAASRSFIVAGTARLESGAVKRRQRLLAFDLDLRGVAVYPTVKNIAEVAKSGGFEFLGQAVSDHLGAYRITFYDWQYRRAERSRADVVVYAVGDGKDAGHVLGHSRLVSSIDYSGTGLVPDLDVIVAETETRTEYDRLMGVLRAFLKESEVSLREIATSDEQLAFTAAELDIEPDCIDIAAAAELLTGQKGRRLSHELLYGIGRQGIALDWPVLHRKPEGDLRNAITRSVAQRIIRAIPDKEAAAFLETLREAAINQVLEDTDTGAGNPLSETLSAALPDKTQRVSFMNAVNTYTGGDFKEFWGTYLPAQPGFKDNAVLISSLLLTQQLTLLTGNHQALVKELQVNRKLDSIDKLFDLGKSDWLDLVKKAGVPEFVHGENDEARARVYAGEMQSLLDAAFPTRRIARMVERDQLPIEKTAVSKGISVFLSKNAQFDFATARIHDFDKEIKAAAGNSSAEVESELMKIQRVFQVSTSPEAMVALLEHGLHSAYTIANIPRKTFMRTYAGSLGGEDAAFAIHQRASHMATKTEVAAVHMLEYSQGYVPRAAMDGAQHSAAMTVLQNRVPNYTGLFGRPDVCECEHCRSVYSAAAYFVDLLRFLSRGAPNTLGETPLDVLAARRPDLLHLPLTCENTNTIIPYIDLANEVMEYYTAHGSLTNFAGYDTGEAAAEELRANPQNFNLEAYRKIKDARYPFTLPYHQPLDVIRTYSDHLNVSRYEAMKAMSPEPDAATAQALAAESLRISEEEHKVIAGKAFDGTADATALHEYFGYPSANELESLSAVPEFLHRSGLAYKDLVELAKTQFINPFQGTLDLLGKIFAHAAINANTIYTMLGQIAAGALDPAADATIAAALTAYNNAQGTHITPADFGQWVTAHLAEFRQVITLHEPDSRCDLETTELRTLQSIYENAGTSGLSSNNWSRIHRLIRLWRKLGWTLHETDVMLAALGETDITDATVGKLHAVTLLETATKLAPNHLAVLWGNIDTYGNQSLYKKLFLNKAVQQIDPAFKVDVWGDYLQDGDEILADHQSAILAAFRMREDDLTAILGVARVIDGGNPRLLGLNTDILNLPNLSTIYRHVVLAKALKLKVTDLCKLIALFGVSPFSTWNIQQKRFTNIAPDKTYEFYELAESTKDTGFKAPVLEYILQGTLPPDPTLGLAQAKILQTAKAVRNAFAAIEQDHPDTPPFPLTTEMLTAKLALTFQPETVGRLMGILAGTASFEAITDANLNVTIPAPLSEKCAYVKGSGRLSCVGVLSDGELATLKALSNDTNFKNAAQALYEAPENFISANLSGILTDTNVDKGTLLDRPAQASAATLETRLVYLYERFNPILKQRLQRDAITQHIAALIRLSDEATALLIAQDIEALITGLSTEGFSATYFSDATWTTSVLQRTDRAVDFAWAALAPEAAVPANHFSVRWEAYLAAPASGEYALVVQVQEIDEAFKLYLDGTLILEKAAGAAPISWEVVATLNAARMHLLRLEYVEASQNAGVSLQWKRATTAPEVIPAAAAYPAATIDVFVALATTYHRAAKFTAGFELTETELAHLIAFSADFGDLSFKALRAADWKRVRDYAALRNAVPQAQVLLTDVFARANATPAPTVTQLRALLYQATAWDEASLQFLVDTHFVLAVNDFKNEIKLNRLRAVMEQVATTGLSAQTIAKWGAAGSDFDELNDTAQLMKNTVKAKCEEQDWLAFAGSLSDKVREHQKQALISYLLTQPAIQTWGAKDADGLFEYFLIDVQMGSCMDTSRIVQANSSVQMFVNRCLLNLESATSTGAGPGVSPAAIDRGSWEWMKNYRVWEANRKVFLYPENWLEPEWRTGRSAFFKDLESYLVQNDITDRSVEQAFRNYLASLNDVANLEVCGMHGDDDGTLHVFARTHNAPYKFFYRRWNADRKWSAWENGPVNIRSVEAGDEGGVHLIPVVWKNRLFLFWPEFAQAEEEPASNSEQSVEQVSDQKMSTLKSRKRWDIHLAWSEHVDGKWSPKQLSKEAITRAIGAATPTESRIRWIYRIDKDEGLSLVAHIKSREKKGKRKEEAWAEIGGFCLADITSRVVPLHPGKGQGRDTKGITNEWYGYKVAFMSFAKNGALELADDEYLKTKHDHKVLVTPTGENYVPTLQDPFFFSDIERTYFVRPVDITVVERIRDPGRYKPYLPSLSAGGVSRVPSAEIVRIGSAFGGGPEGVYGESRAARRNDRGLQFHTFHHPYSSEFVTRLNRSIAGLMQSDTDLPSDDGSKFESVYSPVFSQGFVQKPADFPDRTYYKENVCFDVYGANSIYNWELFFHAPLYIATRLSKNGRFEEAMKWFHYIFDPTTDATPAAGEAESSRYWKVLPFKTAPVQGLEDWFRQYLSDPDTENAIINEWRKNPFDAHLVASNRPLAYMKHVVLKYVENLVAWGDFQFRQFTMESVNEALQIYVIANHILGPRPEFVPKRGSVKAESYDTLKGKWDAFSNALVELENIFPYSSEAGVSDSSTGTSLLGVGSAFYFGIPPNEKLTESWDTVADRLYKIRHCQDIDGVERKLALFSPPIEPGALIQAASQGLSLGNILADLGSPPPIYRFSFLIQKAAEFCGDVKALGSALQAALEKRDADELDRLRASQEIQMLELVTAVRERQVLDAKVHKENLQKARETASFRLQHYVDLLGSDSLTVPPAPTISATLTGDSQLPADTTIGTVETDVDESLVDSGESGVRLIPKEKEELDKNESAKRDTIIAGSAELLAGICALFPQTAGYGQPLGVGTGSWWGGQNLSANASALARATSAAGTFRSQEGAQARTVASYIRREQDWTLQANLAAREIVQLDKQITSADIRIQVAERELSNHNQQIDNAKAVEQFLKSKFTNQELYQWMKEQLFAVYKQSYNLAFEMAKKAERAYRYEMGAESASFIQYGYWDNSRQGLIAGDKLQLALRQLEKSYLDENRRELELTKSVSLARLNPLALIQLRETGKCSVSLPEELFDLDFRGHYFRRIKAVRVSIPCVAGPYTSVSCTLRLLNDSVRVNTSPNSVGGYEHENDEGLPIDDERFRTSRAAVTAIATSMAQNDSGMFDFNFRDERYLPFEGSGAISEWEIELSTERELRQFDHSTISDVILHLDYTARENGGWFKEAATTHIKDFIRNAAELSGQPLMQLFSMKHEFPNEWHKFLHPAVGDAEQILNFAIGKERFPFFAQDRDVVVMKLEVFARCTQAASYHMVLSYVNLDEDTVSSSQIAIAQNATYGGLHAATLDVNDAGLNLEELDIEEGLSLKLKRTTAADYTGLITMPPEVEDMFLVIHYKLR